MKTHCRRPSLSRTRLRSTGLDDDRSAILFALGCGIWLFLGPTVSAAPPLTSLTYRIVGTLLRTTPDTLSVPRNVQGSILVDLVRGDGSPVPDAAATLRGAHLEATLRGQDTPANRLVGEPGQPLLLPPLRVSGDYRLGDIKLVDDATGATLQLASPAFVPVRVFDEVLVSRVTSRPLTLEEIKDKGIAIDQNNFRVVEYDVTLVLKGERFLVTLPVVAPRFKESKELIPVAELEERLAEAARMNADLAHDVELPPALRTANPNFSLNPINFEEASDGDEEERKGFEITGLLVIPGNIAFLNQFFSVQLFTENASPSDSGLAVNNLTATLHLPAGRDQVPSPSYEQPGDDPLRLARIGPQKTTRPTLSVALPGADGMPGTADDLSRIAAGETGTAEFLVEGLKEGLHVVDIDLEGDLEGLIAGVTRIKGHASGSVLVRNASFSFTFAHPRTVRVDEPYEASVTLLNTGEAVANLVSVSINRNAVSGTVLVSEERVELGNVAPGESVTAVFRFRSQRTGTVLFSNLTTSDDSVRGRLSLFAGVDERGVALSPDTIIQPPEVLQLPEELRRAADRVLGQALGVATSPRLPPGILPLTTDDVRRRVLELAEAGQRLRYGDSLRRILPDLTLDWLGARVTSAGFDQVLRETDAGMQFRTALAAASTQADGLGPVARLADRGPDLAGRGQAWNFAAVDTTHLTLELASGGRVASAQSSSIPQSLVLKSDRGTWAAWPAAAAIDNLRLGSPPTTGVGDATVSALRLGTNGTAQLATWSLRQIGGGAVVDIDPTTSTAAIDDNADTAADRTVSGVLTPVAELPPAVLAALQEPSVNTDRPHPPCGIHPPGIEFTVPNDGAIDVDPKAPIDLVFTEALDPGSLQTNGILLIGPTGPVGETLTLLPEPPDAAPRRVRLRPAASLLSKAAYQLLVLGPDQVDRFGHPVESGPRDLAGRLPTNSVSIHFVVRDSEPPRLLSQYPINGAVEVEPEAILRFEFDEPVDTNSTRITLRRGATTVPGSLGLDATRRLLVFTPAQSLPANSLHTFTVAGVADLSGNGTSAITGRFTTVDNLGPAVADLRLAAGQRPVAGATVLLEAGLVRLEPNAGIRFRREGVDVGVVFGGPIFRLPVRLPSSGRVQFGAIGIDRLGNPGEERLLTLAVVGNDPPTLQLARGPGESGPVRTGRRFSIVPDARDDATVARVLLEISGALSQQLELTTPPFLAPPLTLPADALAGAEVVIRGRAIDDTGASSAEASLRLATVDATPPALTVVSPPAGTLLDPLQPLDVRLRLSDNSSSVTVALTAEGLPLLSTNRVLTLVPNQPVTNVLRLSLADLLDGGALKLRIAATDGAGNAAASTVNDTVRDGRPPMLLSIGTDQGAILPTSQPLSPWTSIIQLLFSENLSPPLELDVPVTNVSGRLTNAHVNVAGRYLTIRFDGTVLPPGSTNVAVLPPDLSDEAGNRWRLADGTAPPASGWPLGFRVADVLSDRPTAPAGLVPNEEFIVTVNHEQPFPGWQLTLNGAPPVFGSQIASGTRWIVHLPLDAGRASLAVQSVVHGRDPYRLPVLEIPVLSRTGDEDGDGVPSGWEADFADRRFDPLDPSDAAADFDGDSLVNVVEFQRGTDLLDPDTDNDGLRDGLEGLPGGCPDPLVADSDGDGTPDGRDLAPCVAGEALVLSPTDITVDEGTVTTNLLVATGINLRPSSIDFATDGPPPPTFVRLGNPRLVSNVLSRELILTPSFTDAGLHTVPFRITASRVGQVVFSNATMRVTVRDASNEFMTRWKAPVSGQWSEPTNWTDGLPAADRRAVVDAVGDYTVTLDQDALVSGLTLGGASGQPRWRSVAGP